MLGLKGMIIGGGISLALVGASIGWAAYQTSKKETAEANAALMQQTLQQSENDKAALVRHMREMGEAYNAVRDRERVVSASMREESRIARAEHERISAEIMEALGPEACASVPLPAAAVTSLRRAADYANGIRTSPGEPMDAGSLSID